MKKSLLVFLSFLFLLLCACAQRGTADPVQTVLQALQEQNIAYEPIDLWQAEELPAYKYRFGTLHRYKVQHYPIFSESTCLGVLRVKGSEASFLRVGKTAARILYNCIRNNSEICLCYSAEGCDLVWGESRFRLFDEPNESLNTVTKESVLCAAAEQIPKSRVRFARHLRAEELPSVPTLAPVTPEDIPPLLRTAAPYAARGMLLNRWRYPIRLEPVPEPEPPEELFFASQIPRYRYSNGKLTPEEDSDWIRFLIFAGREYYGEVNIRDELLQRVATEGVEFPLSAFSPMENSPQRYLVGKLERFYLSGDSLAIVSLDYHQGIFLVVNGTVLTYYDNDASIARSHLEEVQAAVDEQGLVYAKAEMLLSFCMVTNEQYYSEDWPEELNHIEWPPHYIDYINSQ